MLFDMHKKSVIVIEYETREHMKEVAKKSQTYDDLINELLELKEASINVNKE
jgi:hypothetical protein